MNRDKEKKTQDPKRGSSHSFILIIMGVIIALIIIQNFIDTKMAKVSFSYELEHLVNLDLIQPEESRKIANPASTLVSFSGHFREEESKEGKNRYKFLKLVDELHNLKSEQTQEAQELDTLKGRVQEAATLFLQMYGNEIPQYGYAVFDEVFQSQDRDNKVIITNVAKNEVATFQEIKKDFQGTQLNISSLINKVDIIIRNLRSPVLGIGDETMKKQLRELDQTFTAIEQEKNGEQQKASIKAVIQQLDTLFKSIDQEIDHVRLNQLRAVRAYKDSVNKYNEIVDKIETVQVQLDKAQESVSQVIWFFNNQELSTRALLRQDPEIFHQWFIAAEDEWKNFGANKGSYFKAPDQPLNKVLEKTFRSEELAPNYVSYLMSFAPIFLILFLLYLAFSRQMKGMGGGAMDFGKSPARLYPKGTTKITFKDVAGIDDCLEELQEIVEFLKNPQKFTALGGRIPKGVLCIGSPGTGKTMVAKAVAGEADCPFFSISGSDFVEMFVGVGASRIRKMFEEAKKNAPCIIFIDEIDAVGRHRGAGFGGGHDEREQTLNQLLVEMDGFDTTEGVIIIAATNRPDVLDKALLRPGRFDRQVYIPLPDIKGRFDILKVHAKKIKLDETVDLMAIARSTPGCSGADLANLLNEAALLAARKNRAAVTSQEIVEARDKVLYGKERRNLEIDQQEKKTTAYHEAGHAIVGAFVQHADPIDKVTIIPRGFSLGATQFLPKKNRTSYWMSELIDQLAVLMGGRVAEQVFVNDISSGAKNDIERATHLARSMVCEWGMSEALGSVAYDERSEGGQYLGVSNYKEKLYSEKTAQEIDNEVKRLLQDANKKAHDLINQNRDIVELMTDMLLEFETLDAEDVKNIVERKWDVEAKRRRMKEMELLHRQERETACAVPPPPPKVSGMSDDNLKPASA